MSLFLYISEIIQPIVNLLFLSPISLLFLFRDCLKNTIKNQFSQKYHNHGIKIPRLGYFAHHLKAIPL